MLRMKMPALPNFGQVTYDQVMPLATKIILGCLICVIDGLGSSALFRLPSGVGYYYGALLITLAIWLVMFRFRDTKLGADVGELCLYEILVATFALMFYQLGKGTAAFWYLFTLIGFLKLIRVYAHFGTTTCDHGWGVFGLMTYFQYKKYPPGKDTPSGQKMAISLLKAICLGVIATLLYKKLPDNQREAIPWAFAFFYVIVNGPILLRAIANVITAFFATKKSETDLTATVNQLETKLASHNNAQVDPDGVGAELIANYYALAPDKRPHYMATSRKLVQLWPAEPPAKK